MSIDGNYLRLIVREARTKKNNFNLYKNYKITKFSIPLTKIRLFKAKMWPPVNAT